MAMPVKGEMKLHWLQHIPFEGLGYIKDWANSQSAEISCTRLFANEELPPVHAFDWLVVMGGPMNIHAHDEHPWLVAEKELIRQAIASEKIVLGICLGAQLIADALGAKIYPGLQKEIGWFPIQRDADASKWLPKERTVFHWHGDTFDLPQNATRLATSAACQNQGFVYNDRVVGLQFHLETTPESMKALIENCSAELIDAPYVQTAKQMRDGLSNLGNLHAAMEHVLNVLLSQSGPKAPAERDRERR